jgi:lantibiotic modifying enzyme
VVIDARLTDKPAAHIRACHLNQAAKHGPCHRANIIGCGVHPVLVDAETLLHPRIGTTPADPLLATEILPSAVVTSCGQTVVYAGIVSIADHRDAFERGVTRMHSLLATAGAPPVPPGGVSRLVLRPTEVYAKFLRYQNSAVFRADPVAGRQRIDQLLARFEDDTFDAPGWEAVRRAEHAALERGDVPYFLLDRRTRDLLADGGQVLAAAL